MPQRGGRGAGGGLPNAWSAAAFKIATIADEDIKSIELHLVIVLTGMQAIENWHDLNAEEHHLAVEDEGGIPVA